MHSVLSFAGSCLVGCLWLVPLLAVAGWSASRLLGRLGPAVEHRLWVVVLLGAVCLPALPLLPGTLVALGVRQHAGAHATLRFAAQLVGASAGSAGFALSVRWLRLALALYGAATLLCVLRLLRSVLGTLWLVRRASAALLTPAQSETWQKIRQAFSVEAELLVSGDLTGPVTVSGARPLLLLPEGFAGQTSETELGAALAHECAHIVRRDFLKNIAYEIVSLPIAFHPATWWVKARLSQSREMLCDEMAVQRSVEARPYSHALLRLATLVGPASQAHNYQAIGIFDANILERRIMKLQAGKRDISKTQRFGLFTAGAVCLAATVAVAVAAPVVVAQDAGQQPVQKGAVYQIGKDVKPPVLRSEADAEFPKSMRKKAPFSGTCRVGLTVDVAGVPQDVRVVHSLRGDFDKNALKAVRQYRFVPGTHNGQPVPVALFVDVKFESF